MAAPLARLLVSSFQSTDTGAFTFANYAIAWGHPRELIALGNSLRYALEVTLLSAVFAVPIAWSVSRTDVPAKGLIRALILGAFITPPYLGAIGWILLAGPNAGWLNRVWMALTGSDRRLRERLQLRRAGVGHRALCVPLYLRLHLRCARSRVLGDGGGGEHPRRGRTADHLPHHPAARSAGDPGGRHHRLPRHGGAVRHAGDHRSARAHPDDDAGAVAILRVPGARRGGGGLRGPADRDHPGDVLDAALLLGRKGYVALTGKGGGRRLAQLGPYRWLALGYALFVVAMAVILPYAALAQAAFSKAWGLGFSWANVTLNNFRAVLFEADSRGTIIHTFTYSAAAACIAVALALVIAYIVSRRLTRGGGLLTLLCMAPLVIPGIVLGVAFYATYAPPPIALYGTAAILVIGYTTRFLPIAYVNSMAGMRSLNPEMEEAVRILGGGRLRAIATGCRAAAEDQPDRLLAPGVHPGDARAEHRLVPRGRPDAGDLGDDARSQREWQLRDLGGAGLLPARGHDPDGADRLQTSGARLHAAAIMSLPPTPATRLAPATSGWGGNETAGSRALNSAIPDMAARPKRAGPLPSQCSTLSSKPTAISREHSSSPILHAADRPGVSRGGPHGRNANLDISDAGVRIVVLRPPAKDDHCLAGFDDRKTFPDSSYDRPLAIGRPEGVWSGKWVAAHAPTDDCRAMSAKSRAPAPPDRSSFCPPAYVRQARPASLLLEQDRALNQAVMGKWKSAERRIDLAHCNRRKLVQHRKLHPFDIDMELAPEMSDKWQGVFIKTATEETDPQPACLAKGGVPAIVQRGAKDQGSGFYAEAKFLAEGRQLNPSAGSYEELPPYLFLQ